MLFKYQLCDCLKQLIQLSEAILPRTDEEIFDWTNKHKGFEKQLLLSISMKL